LQNDSSKGEVIMGEHSIWQYHEMVQAGADHSDVDRAKNYDENMLRLRNFEREAGELIQSLVINENDTIADFGCGTGALTIELAKKCRKIYAVDVSNPMLAIVKEKAQKQGIINIEPVNAGYLTYEHQGEPVDIIVTKGAFHHLPDFWKVVALSRMHEILKPAGRLFLSDVIFSFDIKDYVAEINDFLGGIRAKTGESLYQDGILHIKEEYSTFDWVMDEMLRKTNFEITKKEIRTKTNIDYYCVRK
jgi:ubiquinone/menaquinone biosynthesis C-methylase UbiE